MGERFAKIEEDISEALVSGRSLLPPPPDRWATAGEDEIREFQERVPRMKEAALRLERAFAELYFRVGGMDVAKVYQRRAYLS